MISCDQSVNFAHENKDEGNGLCSENKLILMDNYLAADVFDFVPFFVFFIIAAVLAAFIANWWSSEKKTDSWLNGIVKELGGVKTGGFIATHAANGIFEGYPYNLAYSHAGKNHPETLLISLVCAVPCRFSISSENVWEEIGKKIGFVHEVQTGDEAFDSLFFIKCSDSKEVSQYLSDPSKREIITRLFEMDRGTLGIDYGGISITLGKDRISFRLDNHSEENLTNRISASYIKAILKQMAQL